MKFTPRPASEDDLEQVARIEKVSNRPPWSAESFRQELSKKTSLFWVLSDDDTDEEVIGYAVCSLAGDQLHLQTMAIKNTHQYQGFGRKLLSMLFAFAIKKGARVGVLEVRKSNAIALQLYQNLGFIVVRVQPGMYPDGEEGYSMLKNFESFKGSKELKEQDEDDAELIQTDGKIRSPKNLN